MFCFLFFFACCNFSSFCFLLLFFAARALKRSQSKQELREKRKLLWSGGQPKKLSKKTKKNKGANVPTAAHTDDRDGRAPPVGIDGGAVGTYRLIVTDDGNAIVKRGDFEVVWKALRK